MLPVWETEAQQETQNSWMPDLVAGKVFSTGVVSSSDWQEGEKMATESKNTSACVF